MGCVATITHKNFPVQSDFVGRKVQVCFHYNLAHQVMGKMLRDDMDDPFETIIQLDNGRVVRGVECQWRFVDGA